MELSAQKIVQNLSWVRSRVEQACRRAGRDPSGVQVLAVSKTKPVEDIRAAMAAGQTCFGENYVQEMMAKYEVLGDAVEWHMIGHLQRNKVKYIVDKATLIHSVDSVALGEQIEKEAAKRNRLVNVLLEINMAGEETKFGLAPEEAAPAARAIGALPHVKVCGLMTSAPYTKEPETNRVYFRNMRLLADSIAAGHFPGVSMDTLSMGMTADYEVAVEEGATMVRVGTAIFGERDYHQ